MYADHTPRLPYVITDAERTVFIAVCELCTWEGSTLHKEDTAELELKQHVLSAAHRVNNYPHRY